MRECTADLRAVQARGHRGVYRGGGVRRHGREVRVRGWMPGAAVCARRPGRRGPSVHIRLRLPRVCVRADPRGRAQGTYADVARGCRGGRGQRDGGGSGERCGVPADVADSGG